MTRLPAAGPWASAWLGVRSVVWAAVLPGVVAGYLPWRFFGLARWRLDPASPLDLAGLVCIGAGAVLLGICILEFARSGRGTLAPLDPPRELVVRGLYRYVRNPMYLSVSTILLGEFLVTRSRGLLGYWAAWQYVGGESRDDGGIDRRSYEFWETGTPGRWKRTIGPERSHPAGSGIWLPFEPRRL